MLGLSPGLGEKVPSSVSCHFGRGLCQVTGTFFFFFVNHPYVLPRRRHFLKLPRSFSICVLMGYWVVKVRMNIGVLLSLVPESGCARVLTGVVVVSHRFSTCVGSQMPVSLLIVRHQLGMSRCECLSLLYDCAQGCSSRSLCTTTYFLRCFVG